MQRQEILERAGWQFFRILYSYYINDKHQATAQLWDVLFNHSIQVETRVKKQDNIQLQEKSTQEEQIKNIESEQLSIFKQSENEATETLFLIFINQAIISFLKVKKKMQILV